MNCPSCDAQSPFVNQLRLIFGADALCKTCDARVRVEPRWQRVTNAVGLLPVVLAPYLVSKTWSRPVAFWEGLGWVLAIWLVFLLVNARGPLSLVERPYAFPIIERLKFSLVLVAIVAIPILALALLGSWFG